MTRVHVFYGYAKRRMTSRPRCLFCNQRRTLVAITYFGAPVCRDCWETKWRTSEEGQSDPPFDEITRETTGEWLA